MTWLARLPTNDVMPPTPVPMKTPHRSAACPSSRKVFFLGSTEEVPMPASRSASVDAAIVSMPLVSSCICSIRPMPDDCQSTAGRGAQMVDVVSA